MVSVNDFSKIGVDFSEKGFQATEAYAKGTLRFLVDADGKLAVQNIITGKVYSSQTSSIESVLADAAKLSVSEYDEISPVGLSQLVTGEAVDKSQYGRLSDLVKAVNESVLSSGAADQSYAEAVRKAVGLEGVVDQRLVIERIGFEKAKDIGGDRPLQSAVDNIAQSMIGRGQFLDPTANAAAVSTGEAVLPGLLNIQKDASVLLRFRVGDKYLTTDQITRLLVRTGSQVLDEGKLRSVLGKDSDDILGEIGSTFAKVSKRIKATTSARNLVEGEEGISSLLSYLKTEGNLQNQFVDQIQTLDDAFLIYDTNLESILQTFGAQDQFGAAYISSQKNLGGQKAFQSASRRRQGIKIATRGYDTVNEEGLNVGQQFFRNTLRAKGVADDEVGSVMNFLQEAISGDSGFVTQKIAAAQAESDPQKAAKIISEITSGNIAKHIKATAEARGMSASRISQIQYGFTEALKKTQDGSMFMNDIVFRHRAMQLQDNILQARNNLDSLQSSSGPITTEMQTRMSNLKQNIATWESDFRRIAQGNPIEMIDGKYQKAAFQVRQLDDQTGRIFIGSRSS